MFDGKLNALRGRFGTIKAVTADFERTDTESPVIAGTDIVSWTHERAVIRVHTEQTKVSDVIARLSQSVELIDVTVEAQEIEDVIVQLYKEYQI